jgi:hypothetical protein
MAQKLIRFPVSTDAYALYALPPAAMSAEEAVETANAVIVAANQEDANNPDGGCDDGLTVEDNIKRRLEVVGFVFPEVVDTIDWDINVDPEDPYTP